MFEVYDVSLIPIIVALVEVIKRAGFPLRFVPLLTIAIGQALAFLYISADAREAIMAGLVLAFSAMGLWSGTKNTIFNNNIHHKIPKK